MKKIILLVALCLVAGFSWAGMTTKYKVRGYVPGEVVKGEDGVYRTSWVALRDVITFNEKGEKASSQDASFSVFVVVPEADIKNQTAIKKLVQKAMTPTKTPTPNVIPE